MGKRVFIGALEVAGFCSSLSKGFAANGWKVDSIDYLSNPFSYGVPCNSLSMKLLQRGFDAINSLPQKGLFKKVGGLARYILRLITFLWALWRCDAYIYVWGYSLLPNYWDLKILKKMNVKVIHVFLGSDSRAPYNSGRWLLSAPQDPSERAAKCSLDTKEVAEKLARIYSLSDYVVENPMSGILQPDKFINWFCMGFPTDVSEMPERARLETPLKILHAPSNGLLKGSDHVERVIEELKQEGLDFEYIRLENTPHDQVMSMLAEVDIVVDELYSDCFLAGLGVEAASNRCAVVVGGEGWDELRNMVPGEMVADSIQVSKGELKKCLSDLLANPEKVRLVGNDLYQFVKNNWECEKVASRYIDLIEDQVDEHLWVDKDDLQYFGGMGAEKEKFQTLVRDLIEREGTEALHLPNNEMVNRMCGYFKC